MAKKISIAKPISTSPVQAANAYSATALPAPASLPLDGFSTWNDVEPFVPFSRETARKRELAGKFPPRLRLTQRCTVYSNRELHRWFADPNGYRAPAEPPTQGVNTPTDSPHRKRTTGKNGSAHVGVA